MIAYDPPWSEVRDGIVKATIERYRDELEICSDPVRAAELRGSIRALREIDLDVNPDIPDPTLSNDIYQAL